MRNKRRGIENKREEGERDEGRMNFPIFWFAIQMSKMSCTEQEPRPVSRNSIQTYHMDGRNSVTSAITAASLDQQQQEDRIRSQSFVQNSDTPIWNAVV